MEKWEKDQSNAMWSMFMLGNHQKPNIPVLKNLVHELIHMSTQKTAGQKPYKAKDDIDFINLNRIMIGICCEATTLVLSGKLDGLEKELEKQYRNEKRFERRS